jgi:hypothetical protein
MKTIRAVWLWCMLPQLAFAQSRLRGRALTDSTERPIAGVAITIDELGLAALSDSLGQFEIAGIRAGSYLVSARKIGFGAVSARLRFDARDAVDADFLMTRSLQVLPEARVETKRAVPPKMQEFEERRLSGSGGRFLTQEDIDKRSTSLTSDILKSSIPGLQLVRDGARGSAYYAAGTRDSKARPCLAAVIVDGAFVYQGNPGEQPFDVNSLGPTVLAGVEYYAGPASTPSKYNGTRSACGLMMVLWTR